MAIHLQTPPLPLERIARRGREAAIDTERPGAAVRRLQRGFAPARTTRLIGVDTANIDLLGADAHDRLLLAALANPAPRSRLAAAPLV